MFDIHAVCDIAEYLVKPLFVFLCQNIPVNLYDNFTLLFILLKMSNILNNFFKIYSALPKFQILLCVNTLNGDIDPVKPCLDDLHIFLGGQ